MIGMSLNAVFTSPEDEEAEDWSFIGKVTLSTSVGSDDVTIPGWSTVVTSTEAAAEPAVEEPGSPEWVEPLSWRAHRIADRRLGHLYIDALANAVS
jgi:hypothetical protein